MSSWSQETSTPRRRLRLRLLAVKEEEMGPGAHESSGGVRRSLAQMLFDGSDVLRKQVLSFADSIQHDGVHDRLVLMDEPISQSGGGSQPFCQGSGKHPWSASRSP